MRGFLGPFADGGLLARDCTDVGDTTASVSTVVGLEPPEHGEPSFIDPGNLTSILFSTSLSVLTATSFVTSVPESDPVFDLVNNFFNRSSFYCYYFDI